MIIVLRDVVIQAEYCKGENNANKWICREGMGIHIVTNWIWQGKNMRLMTGETKVNIDLANRLTQNRG